MKLLNPNEAKSSFVNKQASDVVQVGYMKRVLADTQESINKETDRFNKTLLDQRTIYGNEKRKLQEELIELEAKIADGERRMVQLLIPIDGLKERAEEVLASAQMEALSIMTREEEVREKLELLTEKLDDVAEREERVKAIEDRLNTRQIGLESEEKAVSEGHKRLNEELAVFHKEYTQKSKIQQEKENSLNVREMRNKEYLDSRTRELNEQERGLADRRQALDRAFEEIKRLSNKNK